MFARFQGMGQHRRASHQKIAPEPRVLVHIRRARRRTSPELRISWFASMPSVSLQIRRILGPEGAAGVSDAMTARGGKRAIQWPGGHGPVARRVVGRRAPGYIGFTTKGGDARLRSGSSGPALRDNIGSAGGRPRTSNGIHQSSNPSLAGGEQINAPDHGHGLSLARNHIAFMGHPSARAAHFYIIQAPQACRKPPPSSKCTLRVGMRHTLHLAC